MPRVKLVLNIIEKGNLVADNLGPGQEERCFIDRERIDRDFEEYQKNLADGEYAQINWQDHVIGTLDRHNRAEIVELMVAFLVRQGHFDPSVN